MKRLQNYLFVQIANIANQQRGFKGCILEAKERLRNLLAERICDCKITEKQHDFHLELEMKVYVFTPDELFGIIQQEARRMQREGI